MEHGKIVFVELQFNPERDADVLARLDSVDSKQGYIRMLIHNDLIQKGIIQGTIETVTISRGRARYMTSSPRSNLKLVTGGPDQPIIDYLNTCGSKIGYIRSLIRADIDAGGTIAKQINAPRETIDPNTVLSSAERLMSLMRDLAIQNEAFAGSETTKAIKALTAWTEKFKGDI